MQCITLKNFCNKIGFYPNSEKSLSTLAEMIGVSCSYISKLYNARPVSNGGPAWNKVVAFVESYGYQLTNANPADFLTTNISKKNKKLQEENNSLRTENELLKLELEELKELIRVSKRIAEYDNDRRTIQCRK